MCVIAAVIVVADAGDIAWKREQQCRCSRLVAEIHSLFVDVSEEGKELEYCSFTV